MKAAGMSLKLMRLGREHAEFVHGLHADPRVGVLFIDVTALATAKGARAFSIASPKMTRQHRFAVLTDEALEPIGLGMIRDGVRERGYTTLSYAVLPAKWGRGIGTAIARLLCAFGFAELSAPEVRASVKPSNASSLRVLEKIGFAYLGPRERRGPDGQPVEVSRYALTRDRWLDTQSAGLSQ